MGIFFALLSALCQGFGYVSLKKSYRHLKPSAGFALDVLWGLAIWIPISLMIGINFDQISRVLPYAVGSAVLSEAFVFFALSKGEISLTGSLFATYPIYTILFSRFINHDQLSAVQWLVVLLVIFGTIIITLPERSRKIEKKKYLHLIWPILAAITVGISDTLSKHVIDQTSMSTFLFCLAFAQIPVSIGYLAIEYRNKSAQLFQLPKKIMRNINLYRFALLGSLATVLCVLFLWLAFGSIQASIASPLTASYPLYIIIFARILLKEKIASKNWPGITLILENTILITMLTSIGR